MSEKGRYLSAEEAAGELGVSVRTLYAYVSRGLIRSESSAGRGRDRRYRAEDVRRLKERKESRRDPGRAAEGALDWGTPVLESEITLISDGRLYYRGEDAVVLSGERAFEEVAALIWTGDIPERPSGGVTPLFDAVDGPPDAVAGSGGEVGSGIPPTDVFGAALQRAAPGDPAAYDLRPAAVARSGVRILRLLAGAAAGGVPPRGRAIAGALGESWVPGDAGAEALIDRALVLCADHELNVSSFTARCVASAGATPYAVVVAGLQALGGVRHGGNTERVEAFLREAQTAPSVTEAFAARLRRGDAVPGFGHQLYPDGDPRAAAILDALAARRGHAELDLAAEVSDVAADLLGERPNVDFALVVLSRVLGLPAGGALSLFAIGRTAGWIGHATEQYKSGRLIRPRARYVGVPPKEPGVGQP